MNIFILDENIEKCAEYLVDKHIVKMPLETAQILCSVHHVIDNENKIIPYSLTHKNHPCCVWARETLENYTWLCEYGKKICKEYTYRYDKIHACERIIHWCKINIPKNIEQKQMTSYVLAMPDECKLENDAVKSYRNYYIVKKNHLFSWKRRDIPIWINH